MLKELIKKIKPTIKPLLAIVLIFITLNILYTCSCKVYQMQKTKQYMNKLPITQSKYKDLELVKLNKDIKHMKPKIINPEQELTPEEIKKLYLEIPNDYRFNICGETLKRDPRLENNNYDKPLGLMCRNGYRKNISEPIIDSFDSENVLVRGHKQCKV